MKTKIVIAVAISGAVVVMLLGIPAVALAGTSDVGKNLGDEIKSWDTALLLAIAGLLAISSRR